MEMFDYVITESGFNTSFYILMQDIRSGLLFKSFPLCL